MKKRQNIKLVLLWMFILLLIVVTSLKRARVFQFRR